MFSCFSFFYMFRHPPIYTLFPYTTLFRSGRDVDVVLGKIKLDRIRFFARQKRDAPQRIQKGLALEGKIDRKSTRLNSSHLGISYAVFCLKKKSSSTYEEYVTDKYI